MACRLKKIFFAFFFFSFLILPPFSLAQTITQSNVQVVTPILKESTEGAELASASLETPVGILLKRLEAAVERIENIAERAYTRLSKIRKENPKAKNLNTQYVDISRQIETLKIELEETKKLVSNLLESVNPKEDYQFLHEQVVSVKMLLENILKNEKLLVSDMMQLATPASPITVTSLPDR